MEINNLILLILFFIANIPFWICVFGLISSFLENNPILSQNEFSESFMGILVTTMLTCAFAGAFAKIYEDIPEAISFYDGSVNLNLVFQLFVYLISIQVFIVFALGLFESIRETLQKLIDRWWYQYKLGKIKETLLMFSIFCFGSMLFGFTAFYFIWAYPNAF